MELVSPKAQPPALLRAASASVLVFGAMLPETIVIPVIRKLGASAWPDSEWALHAFIAVNLAGACLGGPFLAMFAERAQQRRLVAVVSVALNGAFLLAITLAPPLWAVLLLRFFQGATYIAGVSILMGSIRRAAKTGAVMGVVGCAVVCSILLGIPLGAVLGKTSPLLPLWVGGSVGVGAAFLTMVLFPKTSDAGASRVSMKMLLGLVELRRAVLVVAIERYAVGAFVVTLQLYGHHVLKVSDHHVSGWFTIFLTVFAVGTWPMARLGDVISRWRLVQLGALVYGGTFFLLAAQVAWIPMLLAVGGLASAAIYGPSLGLAAQAAPDTARGSTMALMNAAGTFGMLAGSVTGGAISEALLGLGTERAFAYAVVFAAAGLAQLVSVYLAARAAKVPARELAPAFARGA
jgi:MFS family permease